MNDNVKPHIAIGKRLKQFREWLGQSNQTLFALEHNFNPTQYANWERGDRRIPIDQAVRLEERHGLTLDWIYLGRLHTLPHNLRTALSESPSESLYNTDKDMSDV